MSESSWQCRLAASSLMWRSKRSPSRAWYRRWKKVWWLQLLFGAMPEPSQADASVDAWISLLAASRASRTPTPASASPKKTPAISGQRSAAASSSPAHGLSSSKTSMEWSRRVVLNEFGETFSAWVQRLRQDSSGRMNAVRHMSVHGSLSLPSSNSGSWPTPATPATRDYKGVDRTEIDRGNARPLNEVVAHWKTPVTDDTGMRTTKYSQGGTALSMQAGSWATPRATDGDKGGPNQRDSSGSQPLTAMAATWSTPSISDVTGGRANRSGDRSGELLMNGQVRELSSLLDQETLTDGPKSSASRPALNPRFVGLIMGWCPGLTSFDCSATEWFQYKRVWRCALLSLGLPEEAPRQVSFLGDW